MTDARMFDDLDLKDGRGRAATAPRDITRAGWLDIALRFWRGFNSDNLVLVAAGVAYFTLLAIFPAIVLFVSIYGMVADPAQAANHAQSLGSILPPLAAEFLFEEMRRVASAGRGSLSLVSIFSFLFAAFGAGRAAKATFQALNVAYGEREKRNLLRINLLGLAFTMGFLVAGAFVVFLVVALPMILEALYLPIAAETALSVLRWPILFVGMVIATSVLYRYGPCRSRAKIKWLTVGSCAAAILWLIGSWGISYYASNITDFSATYGTFGALILLQTWLWASALVVLIGAKLNAEMEHQTARDTTTGEPQPLGERGARVADHLGATREQGGKPVEGKLSDA